MSRFLVFVFLWVSSLTCVTASPFYNATTDQNKIVCVFPLSGQYGLLPRILYYCFLAFAALVHGSDWLAAGALASALTFSGTASIHAIILASVSAKGLYDIDAAGAFAVCSAGCIAVMPILEYSNTIRNSRFRPIFGFYATLVSVGSICAAVATIMRNYPVEDACLSSDGHTLLTFAHQLVGSAFECTYSCFSSHQALRNPSDIFVISKWQAFGRMENAITCAVALTIAFGAILGLFSWRGTRKTKTQAEIRAKIEKSRDHFWTSSSRSAANSEARERALRQFESGQFVETGGRLWKIYLKVLNPMAWITVVVLNELYLLGQGGLPSSENTYAISQWAPYVGVGLALIAAATVKLTEPRWKRRQTVLADEMRALESRGLQYHEEALDAIISIPESIVSKHAGIEANELGEYDHFDKRATTVHRQDRTRLGLEVKGRQSRLARLFGVPAW